MALIGSGYHSSWFDDFYVGPPISSKPKAQSKTKKTSGLSKDNK